MPRPHRIARVLTAGVVAAALGGGISACGTGDDEPLGPTYTVEPTGGDPEIFSGPEETAEPPPPAQAVLPGQESAGGAMAAPDPPAEP